MTDKIIIDGVKIRECQECYIDGHNEAMCETYNRVCEPKKWGCYKYIEHLECQLQRKTAECEELKNSLHIANSNHEAAEQECDKLQHKLKIATKVLKGITNQALDTTSGLAALVRCSYSLKQIAQHALKQIESED